MFFRFLLNKNGNMLAVVGLLAKQDLEQFFLIRHQLMDNKTHTILCNIRYLRIKYNTVGLVYATINTLTIKDTSLSPSVDIALHTLVLHENCDKFLSTLWTKPIFFLFQFHVH
ncbi:hypothetical protein BDR03DRAFT_866235 [Suillus americanus]|nr:hypothetical protein BDR03DRAFT_866235 [Suillus americanus]